MLESLPLDKNTSRMIHVITFTEGRTEFKIGRGHESEVRVNDISVSRCHAVVRKCADGFYINDNNSKFGTIILVREPIPLIEGQAVAVQSGRSVISITVRSIESKPI